MYYFCEMFLLSEEPLMKRMRELEEELEIAKDDPLKRKLLETQKKEEMFYQLSQMVDTMHSQGVSLEIEAMDQAVSKAKRDKTSRGNLEALKFLKQKIENTPVRENPQMDKNLTKIVEELSGYTLLDEDKPLHVATEEFEHTLKRQAMIKEHKKKLKAKGIDYDSDDIDEEYEAMKREAEIRRSREEYKERIKNEKAEEEVKDAAYFENLTKEIKAKLEKAQEEMGEYSEETKLKLKEKRQAEEIFESFFAQKQRYEESIMDAGFEEKLDLQQLKDDKRSQQREGKQRGYTIRERAKKSRDVNQAGILWDEDEEM